MHFDLDQRSIRLSAGEFADFTTGPREGGEGSQGLWRAQLGSHWHRQLRLQTSQSEPRALFEVPVSGALLHRGWTFHFNGRVDQQLPSEAGLRIVEIKSVLRTLPGDEAELRSEFPAYFLQLACYLALERIKDPARPVSGELVFVEADTGLTQRVAASLADEAQFRGQLERITAFLVHRREARDRLRSLRIRPAFQVLRPGQENALADLDRALRQSHAPVLFEAPTGFGKTGILLEAALRQLRDAQLERLVYLTSKSTGQLQVVGTLAAMTAPEPGSGDRTPPPSTWVVRPKPEHCVNDRFRCTRDACGYLRDVARRWEKSGVSRLILDPAAPRDIASLRAAGLEGGVCPYEITRAALPSADIWIGDFNYVFAPSARRFFLDQPGFEAPRTLLVVDEAHNLPARVADAYSHRFDGASQQAVLDALRSLRAPQALVQAFDHWVHFLRHLPHSHGHRLDVEDDARHLADAVARLLLSTPLDYSLLEPGLMEELGSLSSLAESLAAQPDLSRLWWSPSDSSLAVTCLDAAPAIGSTLREFGGVVLASATFGDPAEFEVALGLESFDGHADSLRTILATTDEEEPQAPAALSSGRLGGLNKRDTKRLLGRITSGAELLRVAEERDAASLSVVRAGAPWREGAYDVAVDLRVDTSFQHRERHLATTAASLAQWHRLASAAQPGMAVFFPSYAYAEAVLRETEAQGGLLRAALQPRQSDLAAQAAWIEQALASSDALFLVLGSSFAESIDLLGGRVARAMVVGPALPEVNAVQHARMAALGKLGRDTAFRRVYQAPGMQKVNQALGRLVRAPGQHARVLLHCRRFAEPAYEALLAPEYRRGRPVSNDADFDAWIRGGASS